jgi:DHA2 family methylenomycin A resistance protein-like MFS transporter
MTAERSCTSKSRRGFVLTACSLGFGVVQLDVSVVNVAAKSIGASLGGGTAELQWLVDSYTLAFATLLLTAGSLGDRFGAKRMLLTGFALFTLASAACGLAPSASALVAFRAVQGAGAAMLGSCSLALLNHTFPEVERIRAVGIWAAGASAAFAAGPLVGGLLLATGGWRLIFFINVPLGIIAWLLTRRYAVETPRGGGRADVPGQVLGLAMLGALAWATIEAGQRGFGSPVAIGIFGISVLSGAAFVHVERRVPHPMLPLSLFRSRSFTLCVTIAGLINVAFYGLIFVFSLYLQLRLRESPLLTGLAFLPATVACMAGNAFTRHLPSPRASIVIGTLVAAVGLVLLAFVSGAVPLAVALGVVGGGVGLVVPAMTAAVLGSVAQQRSGIASGALTAIRQSGSVLGVALFGSMSSVHSVAWAAVVFFVCCAALARFIGR